MATVGLESSPRGQPSTRPNSESCLIFFDPQAHTGRGVPLGALMDGLERIDHGNRALEDKALVARLREDRIPLTVCPLSNLELRVVEDRKAHSIKRMLDLGLLATVNSDDPAYFGGYINENFRQVANAVGLSIEDIAALARNSLEASFTDHPRF
ncbi:adenosine deaminase family protein [Candidatus Palauibacter sp.]|uniref:adenosine deaminase family protein n=1 Tax=Candidatus Palauibacter sp. TaxID=3101350 RepID=UPI003AF2DF14